MSEYVPVARNQVHLLQIAITPGLINPVSGVSVALTELVRNILVVVLCGGD